MAEEIKAKALSWSLGRAEPTEIDELNILNATMLAMQRAVAGLHIQPDFVLIDGNRPPKLPMPAQAVVKGDSLVAEISAASIIAKVARDQEMDELDQQFPQYGFAQHKGYPTKLHFEKLAEFGATPYHRKSFAPVKSIRFNRLEGKHNDYRVPKTIFTKIINKEIPANIVYQDELVTAFRDIAPQAPTHILIIPNKFIPTVNHVSNEDELALGRLFTVAAKLAQEEGIAEEGYRLVMNCNKNGGQEVFHIHMHLLGGQKLGPLVAK